VAWSVEWNRDDATDAKREWLEHREVARIFVLSTALLVFERQGYLLPREPPLRGARGAGAFATLRTSARFALPRESRASGSSRRSRGFLSPPLLGNADFFIVGDIRACGHPRLGIPSPESIGREFAITSHRLLTNHELQTKLALMILWVGTAIAIATGAGSATWNREGWSRALRPWKVGDLHGTAELVALPLFERLPGALLGLRPSRPGRRTSEDTRCSR
jgi:hypothetical protein